MAINKLGNKGLEHLPGQWTIMLESKCFPQTTLTSFHIFQFPDHHLFLAGKVTLLRVSYRLLMIFLCGLHPSHRNQRLEVGNVKTTWLSSVYNYITLYITSTSHPLYICPTTGNIKICLHFRKGFLSPQTYSFTTMLIPP
jgi:hypothetical protein